MRMDRVVVIPVVKHVQKGITCYTGHMTAAQSRHLTFADHFPPNKEEGKLGYQRLPNPKRAKAFADYLTHTEAGFMTPILLNARDPLDFVPANGSDTVGELRIPATQRLAKIDGQHRGMGIEEFFADPTYPVPFMAFEQLPEILEQQLFVAINREQKKVSMSHVLFVKDEVEGDDELTSIALRLNQDDRSPWHRRVNVIAAAGAGLAVTLQTLREGLGDLLSAGPVKQLPEELKYGIARAFWQVVAETWPEAWAAPKSHLISKAVGVFGLSKSGSFLVADCLRETEDPDEILDVDKLREHLSKARGLDWTSGGRFKGLGGRGGADQVSNVIDAYLFGGPIV
jgi:DGQHR domain-containing protein